MIGNVRIGYRTQNAIQPRNPAFKAQQTVISFGPIGVQGKLVRHLLTLTLKQNITNGTRLFLSRLELLIHLIDRDLR